MQNITFAKVMIVLCLIGSGALAWLDWNQYKQIQETRAKLIPNGEIETKVRMTQAIGREYKAMQEALSNDDLSGEKQPRSYIVEIADLPLVAIGAVSIDENSRASGGAATTDKIYTIHPSDKNRKYDKMNIANFVYTLEEKSPRIRVTKIVMDQFNNDLPTPRTTVKPTEYPLGRFTFSAVATSRERTDG
ncbi:MAG: hypothetical protein O2816_09770 [Planctomycetota bacterium]|nr:hypothetical protein [Planctomycetota bacterium]